MESVELSVSDYSQLGPLERYLRLMAPALVLGRSAGQPAPGEQGALDLLTVVADSTVLVSALRILPEFARSRRKDLSITMTRKGRPFTITATNLDEVLTVLNRLLDD
jgi:hypothetical protein